MAARYLRLFYPTSQRGNIIGGGLSGNDISSSNCLDGLGLVSEFQVYSEWHPARAVLRSPAIDLGSDWNITEVEWDASIPTGSQLLLRSRSGDQVVDENHYFDKNGKEVTQKRYEKLIASFRTPSRPTSSPTAGPRGARDMSMLAPAFARPHPDATCSSKPRCLPQPRRAWNTNRVHLFPAYRIHPQQPGVRSHRSGSFGAANLPQNTNRRHANRCRSGRDQCRSALSVYRNRSRPPGASNCTSPRPSFKTTPGSVRSLSARAERKHCATGRS